MARHQRLPCSCAPPPPNTTPFPRAMHRMRQRSDGVTESQRKNMKQMGEHDVKVSGLVRREGGFWRGGAGSFFDSFLGCWNYRQPPISTLFSRLRAGQPHPLMSSLVQTLDVFAGPPSLSLRQVDLKKLEESPYVSEPHTKHYQSHPTTTNHNHA